MSYMTEKRVLAVTRGFSIAPRGRPVTVSQGTGAQSQSEPVGGGVGGSVTSTFFMSESVHRLVYSEERMGNKTTVGGL